MTTNRWRMGFHIMPPTGWLNDPNGLCCFKGLYHVFHQYSPKWPTGSERGWGHVTSPDLIHWTHHGMAIDQTIPEDACGAYSGSACIVPDGAADGGNLLRLYYTGNVKEPGKHDYVLEGRQANQILIESTDGLNLGAKQVLLRNKDYPACCSCHVRDPKVWYENGRFVMLLGARDRCDQGFVLVMSSCDGLTWSPAGSIRPKRTFGFMWECPDHLVIGNREYLSFCPQGMTGYPWSNDLRDQSGYVELPDGMPVSKCQTIDTDRFRLWDFGFDFYAPQTFIDQHGRTIQFGWMGLPQAPFESAPCDMGWIHCLTVPRELTRCPDGVISMRPVKELVQLHREHMSFTQTGDGLHASTGAHRADLHFTDIQGDFAIELDDEVRLSFTAGVLKLEFYNGRNGAGRGRKLRTVATATITDLRILIDDSAVEIFANGGREVMSTRWFPLQNTLTVLARGNIANIHGWTMGDGMRNAY